MSDADPHATICLCDGNKPNGQSLCAIPEHRIAYLEAEIATLKARVRQLTADATNARLRMEFQETRADRENNRADAAESRARRAETLAKYATAFLLRFGKADQWIQIEQRMTGAWFWKQFMQPEQGPYPDLPSALRALAAAGLLPDDVKRAIGDGE